MFDELLWRAWAARERQRAPSVALVRQETDPAEVRPEDLDRLARGVTELRRRNRSMSDELLAHYGVPVLGRPLGARPGASGRVRAGHNPKIDIAKRWVENWARENEH